MDGDRMERRLLHEIFSLYHPFLSPLHGWIRNKKRLALYCRICIMLLSIWNSVVSYKMFERYIAAASKNEKIMAHPASDPVSWNRYIILIKAYTAIEVVVVMAMVIYTLMY
jgi:hypothetical protein